MEELVQARRLLVAADKRAGDSRSTIRDERHLDDAIQRLSLLQWLGDGEWTGHDQVEGPPTLSGPVESYASPEHRRQQAQARRAAAARVAAQREDSSDLAPGPVWKSNVAAHLACSTAWRCRLHATHWLISTQAGTPYTHHAAQPVEHRVAPQHGLRRPPRALRDRRLLGALSAP